MLLRNILVAASMFFSLASSAQTPAALTITLSRDSVAASLDTLQSLIKRFHPEPFRHITEEVFDRTADSLKSAMVGDLSPLESFRRHAALIALIRDGHSYAVSQSLKNDLKDRKVLPFGFERTSHGTYVNRVADSSLRIWIGRKVLSVNSNPITEILEEVSSIVSVEAFNTDAYNVAFQNFPFLYLTIDTAQQFNIEFESSGGSGRALVHGVALAQFENLNRRMVAPATQEIIGDSIAILSINTFQINTYQSAGMNYQKFLDDFFRTLKKKKITRLIIDVRGNTGGTAEIASYLFSHLIAKPFWYFDYMGKSYTDASSLRRFSLQPEKAYDTDTLKMAYRNRLYRLTATGKPEDNWWFKQQEGRKSCYKGQLITLTDGATFSTAGHFVALLRYHKIGKLAGECSHGNYFCNDGAHTLKLPHTAQLLRLATAQFSLKMPGFSYNAAGICPDHIIPRDPSDIFNHKDTQLQNARLLFTWANRFPL
jgi:hypothetical protein